MVDCLPALRRAVAAVLCALVWCGAGVSTSTPASAQAPPGVLVVGLGAEPRSLDPQTVTSLSDFRVLANLYDGLVRYRPGSLDIAPALARS